ncbi:MAG TPA: hypothetical protein VFQ44_28765 [Streptosporangiaceae bacterium]|nr:hypothetical protein [Streptosporangiaceae bacterium]
MTDQAIDFASWGRVSTETVRIPSRRAPGSTLAARHSSSRTAARS